MCLKGVDREFVREYSQNHRDKSWWQAVEPACTVFCPLGLGDSISAQFKLGRLNVAFRDIFNFSGFYNGPRHIVNNCK